MNIAGTGGNLCAHRFSNFILSFKNACNRLPSINLKSSRVYFYLSPGEKFKTPCKF